MSVTRVAPGIWRAGTRFVNWYVVDAGAAGLTVIDAGLPGYRRGLDAALEVMGRHRADVAAVVLTHGHIDHVGMAGELAGAGARVYLHPSDAALAQNPRRNRTDSSPLPYLRYPAPAAFAAHCIAQGVLRPPAMPEALALHDGQEIDVPGAPLVHHTPGHTDGSCVLEFREHGVAFIGDLLCTVDQRWGRPAPPQLQTRGSNRDSDQALASLDLVEGIGAQLVLPGHGGPYRDGLAAAVVSAREIGCS